MISIFAIIKRSFSNSTALKSLFSFLFSILFIMGVSAIFLNSERSYEWEPGLNRYINKPGTIFNMRSEGWATTHIGKYDIPGIPDIKSIEGTKVTIWGDSYIEAWQVNDEAKTASVLTKIAREYGSEDFMAFSVGHSGDCVADYYFGIPKYENIIQDIRTHFIVITCQQDILPDQHLYPHSLFISEPAVKLIEGVPFLPNGNFQRIKALFHKYGLDFIIHIYNSAGNISMRFVPNANTPEIQNIKETDFGDKQIIAWRYLLEELRKQTKAKIVFVYCPSVPSIVEGRISYENKDEIVLKKFADECAKAQIDFIDMTDLFCDYYRKTGKFPRGFANSRPAAGHFNANGHRIVAEKIFTYLLKENYNAFYSH
jgi:hypothetical protein